ncbi:substrate-binding periplasmic protein [Labrys neptuniae]
MRKPWRSAAALAAAAALSAILSVSVGASEVAAPKFEFPGGAASCGDDSYQRAVRDGVVVGISPSAPYSFMDAQSGQAGGIDVELLAPALAWAGITNVKYEISPFGSLIPALNSGRIDILGANIHVTEDRLAVIAFSGPAWWYGPAIIVRDGTGADVKSFKDLSGRKVGAVAGSAADEYLRALGADVMPFQTDSEEFLSLSQGRVDIILEDDVKFLSFKKNNPDTKAGIVPNVDVPDELIYKRGYGYARFGLRKDDCSLRAMLGQGLAEVRANGTASAVLAKYGLTDRNLFYFPLTP